MSTTLQAHVSIDVLGFNELTVEQVWPDGDAPDNPTADDVAAVIKQCGGLRRVLDDWNLDRYLVITVSRPNPEWQDGPALIPELAAEPLVITQAEVPA